jgi:DNA-binding transcriptional regulator LsrR (DeoR family)
MPRPADNLRVVEVAYLTSLGLNQTEVAGLLSCSQPEVSRRLRNAISQGFLLPQMPLFESSAVPPELLEAVEKKFSLATEQSELAEHYRGLRNGLPVRIFVAREFGGSSDENSDPESSGNTSDISPYSMVAKLAAQRLAEHLPRMKQVGVTYGSTLKAVVAEFRRLSPAKDQRIKVYPLTGDVDLLNGTHKIAGISSTELSNSLSTLLSGMSLDISLHQLPIRIPSEFAEDRDRLLRYFSTVPGYSEIYGGIEEVDGRPQPRCDGRMNELDTILTGVGPAQQRDSDFQHFEPQIVELVVGEIAGCWVPIDPQSGRDRTVVEKAAERVMTPPLSFYVERTKFAAEHNRPGVVIIATGEDRVAVIDQLIRIGACSELITDAATAQALLAKSHIGT